MALFHNVNGVHIAFW